MPVLTNSKHELFAQELAQGKSASEAYRNAGYTESRSAASRLLTNVNVVARVNELKSRIATGVIITRQKTLEELAAIGYAPVGSEHIKTSDKRQALMDIAKLEGWIIDRTEVGGPGAFDQMSDDELRDFIAQRSHRESDGSMGSGKTH